MERVTMKRKRFYTIYDRCICKFKDHKLGDYAYINMESFVSGKDYTNVLEDSEIIININNEWFEFFYKKELDILDSYNI